MGGRLFRRLARVRSEFALHVIPHPVFFGTVGCGQEKRDLKEVREGRSGSLKMINLHTWPQRFFYRNKHAMISLSKVFLSLDKRIRTIP